MSKCLQLEMCDSHNSSYKLKFWLNLLKIFKILIIIKLFMESQTKLLEKKVGTQEQKLKHRKYHNKEIRN